MPKLYYRWRCDADVMMLEEAEWAEIRPLMTDAIQAIKDFRRDYGASLEETLTPDSGLTSAAQEAYFRFTGRHEADPNKLYHHHLSYFGGLCKACGKLLRTPKARFCAACGAPAQQGVQADVA